MEHGARLSTSRVMAIAFIFMSVLIVLSLSVNVIQGVNNYRLQNEQRTAVTPMAFNAPFAVSQNSADASYLQQMALSFIALRLFARQGEVMNPLQYVPFNQTLYFINGDDPAQVAWMKRQTPPTLESKIILVQGSIPEMQKSLDSRVYFDQNGVLCQRLSIDQVPARVSAVPGDRFLKVEFIPAEEGRK
ncbi:conjugal transfer protein TraW [Escherichia coli]|uniref:TraE/TraK family type IV conjugative transfer system protein n=1 Tax=Escherichia coli TaxID=562 RepID=UPI000DA526B1|nr:TraE/TraK family type IV conjugative transfer system protein [Escherichia coli]SQK25849.1 conjugal transfer protein TraW [Escherichia coli]